jgi:hypothetical protein
VAVAVGVDLDLDLEIGPAGRSRPIDGWPQRLRRPIAHRERSSRKGGWQQRMEIGRR